MNTRLTEIVGVSTSALRQVALASALGLFGLFTVPAFSQVGTTASVSGSVTDESGASLAGAAVVIHNTDTGIDRTTQTSGNGSYAISQLQPGHYTISVSEAGFKSFQQQNITLTIGQIAEINAHLQIGTQQEQVTVTAGAPAIQTEDASVGLVIDSATITDTPLNATLSNASIFGRITSTTGEPRTMALGAKLQF